MSKKGDTSSLVRSPDVQAVPVQLATDEYLRLCCIHMVMVIGSEVDRENPTAKAEKLFKYVKGEKPTEQEAETKTEE